MEFNVKKSVSYSTITAIGDGLKCGYAEIAESVTVVATESDLLEEGDFTAVMKSTVDDTQQALVEVKDQGNEATAGDYVVNFDYEDFTLTNLEPPNAS